MPANVLEEAEDTPRGCSLAEGWGRGGSQAEAVAAEMRDEVTGQSLRRSPWLEPGQRGPPGAPRAPETLPGPTPALENEIIGEDSQR